MTQKDQISLNILRSISNPNVKEFILTEEQFAKALQDNRFQFYTEEALNAFKHDLRKAILDGRADSESLEKANKDIKKLMKVQIVGKTGHLAGKIITRHVKINEELKEQHDQKKSIGVMKPNEDFLKEGPNGGAPKEVENTNTEDNGVYGKNKLTTLLKAKGVGSRGGKVIGHTKSGKPIYEKHDHPEHSQFYDKDHRDAAEIHKKLSKEHKQRALGYSNKEHKEAVRNIDIANKHDLQAQEHNKKSDKIGKTQKKIREYDNKKVLENPKKGEEWETQGEHEGYVYDIQTEDGDISIGLVDKKGELVKILSSSGEQEYTPDRFIKKYGDFKIGKQRKPEDFE